MGLTVLHATAARLQGARLRAGRLDNAWSQRQAAEFCGVTKSTWIKWERGERQSPEAIRRRLAVFWGLDGARLGLDPERACPCCGQPYG